MPREGVPRAYATADGGPARGEGHRRVAAAACVLALGACSLVHERARESGPQSRPAGREGMLTYTVGRLSFEAPAGWQARGDPRHVLLVSPAGDARIDAQVVDHVFSDDAKCLADAEAALARGGSRLTKVRRHPSTLAGRRSLVQEGDQDRWHGWAWAVCDGGEQYRIFFTGLSPLKEQDLRVVRSIPSTAVLAGRPSARPRTRPVPVAAARTRAVAGEGASSRTP